MLKVVLVEPKYDGNVGAVARAMKNFSLSELVLVNPCKLGKEAYKRAMHASELLDKAKTVEKFDEALKGIDCIIGTTGVANLTQRKVLRTALTPKELAAKLSAIKGRIALVFGREDFGLLNEELKKCDLLVTIPCSKKYPIMNLSHAASIIFYELFKKGLKRAALASKFEREKLFDKFSELLDEINYPKHRKENTKLMFRRIMGRAAISRLEFYTLMGILSRACKLHKSR